MVSIDTLAPGILRFDLNGVVTDDDIAAMRGALQPLIDGTDDISLLIDLADITDVTGSALAADLRAEAALLPYWRRFARIAAITDKEWVGNVMRVSAHLLPKLDLRTFGPDDADAAVQFVLGEGPERESPARSVRVLDTAHPNLLAFEIDGVLHKQDAEFIQEYLEQAQSDGRRVSLLVRATDYRGFDPTMMFGGSLWSMKLNALTHLHRYAVVGMPAWVQSMANLANPLSPLKIAVFDLDEEDEARDWAVVGLDDG
ncbi:MAG: STAS/SEC14 domain-containing protein [Pseudomonadota bacterium]